MRSELLSFSGPKWDMLKGEGATKDALSKNIPGFIRYNPNALSLRKCSQRVQLVHRCGTLESLHTVCTLHPARCLNKIRSPFRTSHMFQREMSSLALVCTLFLFWPYCLNHPFSQFIVRSQAFAILFPILTRTCHIPCTLASKPVSWLFWQCGQVWGTSAHHNHEYLPHVFSRR